MLLRTDFFKKTVFRTIKNPHGYLNHADLFSLLHLLIHNMDMKKSHSAQLHCQHLLFAL
jgi:hypothetical protein